MREKPEPASLAASTFGCYENCIHNKAFIDIIDLVGAKGLKFLRLKHNSEFGKGIHTINKCERRPELQTRNTTELAWGEAVTI